MAGKKRVGGIKPGALRSAAPPVVLPGSGKFGECPDRCAGAYKAGQWVHAPRCRWTAILWRDHGNEATDWACPFGCEAVALASGWTHQHDCAYWAAQATATPF